MKKTLILLVALFSIVPSLVFATTAKPELTYEEVFSAFKNKAEITGLKFIVPTVVEANISNQIIERSVFAVYDTTAKIFTNYLFLENYVSPKKPVSIISDTGNNLANLFDNNYSTFSDFELLNAGLNKTNLTINYSEKIATDNLEISLDRYVALPNEISIYYFDDLGNQQIIVNRIKPTSSFINFPKISTNKLVIDLSYSQPLRINEISLKEANINKDSVSSIRFLSEPNHEYQILFNPDRNVLPKLGESPNLSNNNGVKKIGLIEVSTNLSYVRSDIDKDSIPDELDNCVNIANFDQTDVDVNGRGDACDDFDQDGILNSSDNCINKPNRGQQDIDRDRIGDACDSEESRFTEKYPALVWGGIIFAVIIFLALFFLAFKGMNNQKKLDGENNSNQ